MSGIGSHGQRRTWLAPQALLGTVNLRLLTRPRAVRVMAGVAAPMTPANAASEASSQQTRSPTEMSGISGCIASVVSAPASVASGMSKSSATGSTFMSGISGGGLVRFTCAKCRLEWSMSVAVQKGNQIWCEKDNRTYNALVTRWARNPKLKKWWTSLSPVEQQKWFVTWQQHDPKRRFELLQYIESTIVAQELIEDDVDRFVPFSVWRRDRLLESPDMNDELLSNEWRGLIDSMRHECLFRRGQWLMPRYEGLERRSRTKISQQQQLMRSADLSDPDSITALWQSGQSTLNRFREQMPAVQAPPSHFPDPVVSAAPHDMPQAPEVPNLMFEAIKREARGCCSVILVG